MGMEIVAEAADVDLGAIKESSPILYESLSDPKQAQALRADLDKMSALEAAFNPDRRFIKPVETEAQKQQQAYIEYGSIFIIAVLVITALYFLAKKGHIQPSSDKIKAVASGWVVWSLCVYSYNQLLGERLEYAVWLTLPVFCVLAIYAWVNKYISRK